VGNSFACKCNKQSSKVSDESCGAHKKLEQICETRSLNKLLVRSNVEQQRTDQTKKESF
jgi:hypothetical protein